MIWAQLGNNRIDRIPPDGISAVDIYAEFSFGTVTAGQVLPPDEKENMVQFLIGKATIPENVTTARQLIDSVIPIDGITFKEISTKIKLTEVATTTGEIESRYVAKATINPIDNILKDSIDIVAYSTYDRAGTVERLSYGQITLTVAGEEGDVYLTSAEKYVANAWTDIAPMNLGRTGAFAGDISGKMYVAGGYNGNFLSSTEEYTIGTDSWADKASMTTARAYGASVVMGGYLYCIGGINFSPKMASNKFERFNGTAWESLDDMPVALGHCSAIVVGTDIWVFGGAIEYDDKTTNPLVYNQGILKWDGSNWSIADVAVSPTITLSSSVNPGDLTVTIPSTTVLNISQGYLTLHQGTHETVRFISYQNGVFTLADTTPLVYAHTAGVNGISIAIIEQKRLSGNLAINGTEIKIYNGIADGEYVSLLQTYDTITNVLTDETSEPVIARSKATSTLVSGLNYIIGGSAVQSDYLNQLETLDAATDTFTDSGLTKMSFVRTGHSAVNISGTIYVVGGQGCGHDRGWVQLTMEASPSECKADGLETSSITITAKDASGEAPPDGTIVKVKGLLFLERPTSQSSSNQQRTAPPTISILPVLFSEDSLTLTDGMAATTLLPRSEDEITEVVNLSKYVQNNEQVIDQWDLKKKPETTTTESLTIGDSRTLYSIAIEAKIEDAFYFGITDSTTTTGGGTSSSTSNFLAAESLKQGVSAQVSFYSDIVSLPYIQVVTDTPVTATEASTVLDELAIEIPFGSSPHYDAMVIGAKQRVDDNATNIMISASDNDNNGSVNTAANVIAEINKIDGYQQFPVFITTFIVTDPISLSARKSRTDVSELEEISSETGGRSYSIVDDSYINWVVDEINTSAPSSIGSGTITIEHDMPGRTMGIEFVVGNMVSGNYASMTVQYSQDGYNWEDTNVLLEADVGAGDRTASYTWTIPLDAQKIKYVVKLGSSIFDSPILKSVTISYINPNVKYLFFDKTDVSGQILELTTAVNHNMPSGSTIQIGIAHGETTEFERDFDSLSQPAVEEQGTIVAINRAMAPLVNGEILQDIFTSTDGILWKSKSGSWAQDSVITVLVDNVALTPNDYSLSPEDGAIIMHSRISTSSQVAAEITNLPNFRVGLKITNPTLNSGTIDSVAYMWTDSAVEGNTPNKLPTASNLFISPDPVLPGGPITANYTFRDPDNDEEDTALTQIIWYRDNVPVPELNNKTSFTNSDLLAKRLDAKNSILKGQKWHFSVRPSDGKNYGPIAVSAPIIVSNSAPTASNAHLISSNIDSSKFTTSDNISVEFTYVDNDSDANSGTLYSWYINGIKEKESTSNVLNSTDVDKDGKKLLIIGNSIYCTITPYDGTSYGEPISTSSVSIQSSVPVVSNVVVTPPSQAYTTGMVRFTVTYTFTSLDNLKDQSRIYWYSSTSTGETRRSEFDGVNQILTTVSRGQNWWALVEPYDGYNVGTSIKSNIIAIN